VLVMGAENDAFVYRGGLEATAQTYGTKAEIFPGMAHAMMLEHGWEKVADRILEWLDEPSHVAAEKKGGRNTRARAKSGS
jgi:alpha-beta hydrolase superfamily lysophospholipase